MRNKLVTRILTAVLAAAMVLTTLPGATVTALAAEQTAVSEEVVQSNEADENIPEESAEVKTESYTTPEESVVKMPAVEEDVAEEPLIEEDVAEENTVEKLNSISTSFEEGKLIIESSENISNVSYSSSSGVSFKMEDGYSAIAKLTDSSNPSETAAAASLYSSDFDYDETSETWTYKMPSISLYTTPVTVTLTAVQTVSYTINSTDMGNSNISASWAEYIDGVGYVSLDSYMSGDFTNGTLTKTLLPGTLYATFSSGITYKNVLVSTDDYKTSLETVKLDSDTQSYLINSCLGGAESAYQIEVSSSNTNLYAKLEQMKFPIEISSSLTLNIKNGTDDEGNAEFYLSKDKKYMMVNSDGALKFTVSGCDTTTHKVLVKATRSDSEGNVTTSIVSPYEEEDGTYSIELPYLESLSVIDAELKTVTFACSNAHVYSDSSENCEWTSVKVAEGDTISFYVKCINDSKPDKEYVLNSISADTGEKLTYDETTSMYSVPVNGDTTINIVAIPTPDELTVVNMLSDGSTVEVEKSTVGNYTIYEEEGMEGTYMIPYTISKVKVAVTRPAGTSYSPTVIFQDENRQNTTLSYVSETQGESFDVYNYEISAELLTSTCKLYVAEAGDSVQRTFSINMPAVGIADVSITDGEGTPVTITKDENAVDGQARTDTVTLNFGKTYKMVVTAADNYNVNSLKIGQYVNGKRVDYLIYSQRIYNKTTYSLTFTALADATVDVTAAGQLTTTMSYGGYTIQPRTISSSGDRYYCLEPCEAGANYSLTLTSAGKPVTILGTYSKRLSYVSFTRLADSSLDTTMVSADGQSLSLSYTSDGRKGSNSYFSIIYEDASGEKNYVNFRITWAAVRAETLSVSGASTVISLPTGYFKNVTIRSGINYTTGSKNSTTRVKICGYLNRVVIKVEDIKVDGESKDKNSYTDSNGQEREYISAYFVNNRNIGYTSAPLRVVAGDIQNVTANVKLYFADDLDKAVATIPVSTTAISDFTPTVSVVSSDDVSVTIKIKGAEEYTNCFLGTQYYKIVATPKDTEAAALKGFETRTFYVDVERPTYPEEPDSEDEKAYNNYVKQCDKINKSFYQTVKLALTDNPSGQGAQCEYNIEVSMVQTKAGVTIDTSAVNPAVTDGSYWQLTPASITATVKEPVFEGKISVKKGTTTIATGQENILAGTAVFSKATTCTSVQVEDVTAGLTEEEKITYSIVDGKKIYVTAYNDTAIGKHTLRVTPVTVANLYAPTTSFDVNVVQGITALEVAVPTTCINLNTSRSFQTKLIFNEGLTTPKKKSVTYSIVGADGNDLELTTTDDDTEAEETEDDKIAKYVSISSSGKVTIKKQPTDSIGSYSFRIKVQATDNFYGISAISDEINVLDYENGGLAIVCLAKWSDIHQRYEVISNPNGLETEDLDGAIFFATRVRVLNDARTDLREIYDHFYPSEMEDYFEAVSEYTLTSSNKNITVTKGGKYYYKIGCTGQAANVSLKATLNCSTKVKKTLKVSTKYALASDLNVAVTAINGETPTYKEAEAKYEFTGTVNSQANLKVRNVDSEGTVSDFTSLTNYGVSVSGGKLISSDYLNGDFKILLNTAKATVTVTNKGLKKTDANYKKVFTIVNTAYSTAAAPTTKLTGTVLCATTKDQTVTITSTLSKKSKYSLEDKYLLLEEDTVSSLKSSAIYGDLAASMSVLGTPQKIVKGEDGKYTVNLTLSGTPLKVGSYKLTATYGTYADGVFTSDAKPVSLTLKVIKPKANKPSIKVKTSYKITKDKTTGQYQTITLDVPSKAKKVSYTNIYDANISGKENAFLQYFDFDSEAGTLKLKSDLTSDQITYITGKKAKNDRICYLTYTMTYGDDGYGNPYTKTETVKVTITF